MSRHIPDDARKRIDDAIDKIGERLASEGDVAFSSDGEREGALRASFARLRKARRDSRRCSFPDCANASIRRSHTLQKEGPLRRIAEAGHVLQPVTNLDTRRVTLKRVGVNEASALPIFCSEHEAVFASFESSRGIVGEADAYLQLFRTACREVVEMSLRIEQFARDLATVAARRDRAGRDMLAEELGDDVMVSDGLEISDVEIQGDDAGMAVARRTISSLEARRAIIQTHFVEALAPGTPPSSRRHGAWLRFPRMLPLALAGVGFADSPDARGIGTYMVMNVLPDSGHTDVIAAVVPAHASALDSRFEFCSDNPRAALDMIEAWALNATDHWFLTPSVWERMPETRRVAVLEAIERRDLGALDRPPAPLLNDARCYVLDQLRRKFPDRSASPALDGALREEEAKVW